jgi:hypothetical protein
MNCAEPVPSGLSTPPIRPSLPGIKRPQAQRALDGTALQLSAMKVPMPIRERPSIAKNPPTRTGQQGIASKSSPAAQPRRQRSKEGHG